MGPSFSDMPYFMTMSRATFVACWISPDAPVEISSRNSCSAMRPPSAETMLSNISPREVKSSASSALRYHVKPPAAPRGMMVI